MSQVILASISDRVNVIQEENSDLLRSNGFLQNIDKLREQIREQLPEEQQSIITEYDDLCAQMETFLVTRAYRIGLQDGMHIGASLGEAL